MLKSFKSNAQEIWNNLKQPSKILQSNTKIQGGIEYIIYKTIVQTSEIMYTKSKTTLNSSRNLQFCFNHKCSDLIIEHDGFCFTIAQTQV